MKILFDSNLTFRGTTTAVLDYAKYNQEVLGNESIICHHSIKNSPTDENFSKKQEVAETFRSLFHTFEYEDFSQLESFVEKSEIDYFYSLKPGFNNNRQLNSCKNINHCVFQHFDPHGHRYAYISKWLSTVMSNNTIEYVPHIVDLPREITEDFRIKHAISKDSVVIGRYGGVEQFDINWVYSAISRIVNTNEKVVFVFVNTFKFIDHPRVLFLPPIIDPQEKTNFINSCDAMIHARSGGESFGLAICEFLFHNKPVFAWNNGTDKNHIELLRPFDTLYNDENDLVSKIESFLKEREKFDTDYQTVVNEFEPKKVINKFNTIFLK